MSRASTIAIGASPNGAASVPLAATVGATVSSRFCMKNEGRRNANSQPRALDALLAAPVGDGGRRGAVRAERGRAAGDLHDPLHAGGDGGVDRGGLEQILVGPVRR